MFFLLSNTSHQVKTIIHKYILFRVVRSTEFWRFSQKCLYEWIMNLNIFLETTDNKSPIIL